MKRCTKCSCRSIKHDKTNWLIDLQEHLVSSHNGFKSKKSANAYNNEVRQRQKKDGYNVYSTPSPNEIFQPKLLLWLGNPKVWKNGYQVSTKLFFAYNNTNLKSSVIIMQDGKNRFVKFWLPAFNLNSVLRNLKQKLELLGGVPRYIIIAILNNLLNHHEII